jgi:hypothetical protein
MKVVSVLVILIFVTIVVLVVMAVLAVVKKKNRFLMPILPRPNGGFSYPQLVLTRFKNCINVLIY